jgi:lincosamide nucleotidyltransferase A/C/D/E
VVEKDAANLIALLEQNGLEVYVDGGWAVDAVLGEQTRPHDDLDIALPHAQVPRLRALLGPRGFREQRRDDNWECNFVLADEAGRRLDVHSYTLDEAGLNVAGVPYNGQQLTGRGVIGGYSVRCISPEWLVKFHTGYELDDNDWHDVRLLCQRFQIAVPDEYLKFFSNMAEPLIALPTLPGAPRSAPFAAVGQSFMIKEWRGSGPATLHVHHADDEAWHVLEGTLHFRFADRELDVPAGGTVFVPAGVAHTYHATDARYLIVLTPRLDALIRELQTIRDPAAHPAIYRKYESSLLE